MFDVHSRGKPQREAEEEEEEKKKKKEKQEKKKKKKGRRRRSRQIEAASVASAGRNNLLTEYQMSTGRSLEYCVRPVTSTHPVDTFATVLVATGTAGLAFLGKRKE